MVGESIGKVLGNIVLKAQISQYIICIYRGVPAVETFSQTMSGVGIFGLKLVLCEADELDLLFMPPLNAR